MPQKKWSPAHILKTGMNFPPETKNVLKQNCPILVIEEIKNGSCPRSTMFEKEIVSKYFVRKFKPWLKVSL